jgi:hypothetical protein
MARTLTPAAPAGGRASAAPAVPASLVPPLGLGGHPRTTMAAGESSTHLPLRRLSTPRAAMLAAPESQSPAERRLHP